MSIDLKNTQLFRGLSQSEFETVKSCLREKSFDKGEVLFHEGHSCQRVFIVREGRVKVYRISSSGREQILEILEPGDTCACNPGVTEWACSATSEAVTPCKVWFLSRDHYIRMVETNPSVSHAITQIFADRLKCFSTLIDDVSLKDTKSRLIRFLIDMAEENSKQKRDPLVLDIPFTQEEIAQRLGTARETVARNLSEMKSKKLIDIKPKQILILDKKALEKMLL